MCCTDDVEKKRKLDRKAIGRIAVSIDEQEVMKENVRRNSSEVGAHHTTRQALLGSRKTMGTSTKRG